MLKIIQKTVIDNIRKGPIYRSLFNNGATLLFHHSPGFSGACVNLNFIAGSIFESEKEEGMAHLIEHLLFKETNNSTIKMLEQKGAELNAYTYKENVCFEMSCLSSRLNDLLPMFFEVFMNLDFSSEQLRKEKKVVIQELNEDKDDHETQGLEFVFKKNFTRAIGHPVGGKASNIKSFLEKDIRKYYKKHFTPERMILTIVADEKEVGIKRSFKQALKKYTSNLDRKPFRLKVIERSANIDHFKGFRTAKMEAAISYFSFTGPSVRAKNSYDYVVLDELLFEGLSSMFFKKFREEKPLVYGLGSTINSFSNCGSYIMVFNSNLKDITHIELGVKDVLANIATNGPDDKEVQAIKNKIMDAWQMAFDSIDERAEFIAENEIYDMQDCGIPAIDKKINEVTSESIKKLVKTIFQDNNYSILVLKNKSKIKKNA